MTCPSCLKPIDEAFDAVAKDGRGRMVHTDCLIEQTGRNDAFHDPDFDVAVFGVYGWLARKLKGKNAGTRKAPAR